MVAVETGLRLLGGVVLLLGNAFFVTTEFALTRVRQFPASEFQGSAGLERAWEMTERLEIYLSSCQVGITICSVGLGVVAEPAAAAVLGPPLAALGVASGPGAHTATAVIGALAIINLLHVIVGEQVPTYLGVERTKFVARYGGPALYWWAWLMSPVIYLADWTAKRILGLFGVTIDRSWTEEELEEDLQDVDAAGPGDGGPTSRAELRRRMGESMSSMGLSDERRREVINALDIGEQPVEDIVVDADEVVWLRAGDDLEANLERMRASPHVRYPLVGEDRADVRGVVYAPRVLRDLEALENGEGGLEELAAPPMTVAPETSVSDLIDRFQAEKQELAVVVSDGEALGVVTTTDAFEAIAGELEDPIDVDAVPT